MGGGGGGGGRLIRKGGGYWNEGAKSNHYGILNLRFKHKTIKGLISTPYRR